jgi:hypothetical protein
MKSFYFPVVADKPQKPHKHVHMGASLVERLTNDERFHVAME